MADAPVAAKRSRRSWGRFLLIWALSLLVIGLVGCAVLYRYLAVYEVTRPEPVVEAYLEKASAKQLIAAAKKNPGLDLTAYEDAGALYASYLEAIDTDLKTSYRKNANHSSAEQLNYVVYSGPNAICSLILTPEGRSPGFGRYHWRVSEVTSAPITDQLPSVKVEVYAVDGTALQLNGRPLSEEDVAESGISIPDLSRFEASLDPVPTFRRYEIGPLYGSVELTDSTGNTLSPDSNEGGILRYYASAGTGTVTIRAPEDISVFVNGVELDRLDITSSDAGVLEGLSHYAGEDFPMTSTFRLAGLYLTPEVTAVDADGKALTPLITDAGTYCFFYANDPEAEEALRDKAEGFFNAYTEYSSHSWNVNRSINLLNRIMPNSRLYSYVQNSRDTMIWASGTLGGYEDIVFDHFHAVSDRCITCTVRYRAEMKDANGQDQDSSFSMENAYELSFVAANGSWLAAAMNVIADA